MTERDEAEALVRFRDAVAADLHAEFPQVDYIAGQAARIVEKRAVIIGWDWFIDGPHRIKTETYEQVSETDTIVHAEGTNAVTARTESERAE